MLTVSNLRKVGLREMVRGLGGRNAAQGDGCRESEISRECLNPVIRVGWLRNGLDAQEEPLARGMQRESANVSLAKIASTAPHILHLTLFA